jgi:hypothetical protein
MWRRLAIGAGVATALVAGPVRGEPPPELRVVGDEGACPSPAAVVGFLGRLLPQSHLTTASGPARPEDVAIADAGPTFRVSVAGQERPFTDPPRECTERARNAAVFVALVLDPPALPALPTPAPPAPGPPPAPPVHEAPRAPAPPSAERPAPEGRLLLDASPIVGLAPGSGAQNLPVAIGAALGLRWRRAPYVGLSVGAFAPTLLRFQSAEARATRFPLDLSVGVAAGGRPWEVAAELGPSATILSLRGDNLDNNKRQVRLELGARAAVALRFWLREKNALFLSFETTWFPRPYALEIRPQEHVGTTPPWWLGASIGVSFEIE